MHNIYYLGLSGERSLPFGLLVSFYYLSFLSFYISIMHLHVFISRLFLLGNIFYLTPFFLFIVKPNMTIPTILGFAPSKN